MAIRLTRFRAFGKICSALADNVASMTPLGRIGMPDGIAGAITFFSSNLSDYLTGEYIPIKVAVSRFREDIREAA